MSIPTAKQLYHFRGLSTETKPKPANMAGGSTFLETDTGIEFIYTTADETWKPVDASNIVKSTAETIGILSIEKTSTSPDGIIDTYTIKYTNGARTTFEIRNGNKIVTDKDINKQVLPANRLYSMEINNTKYSLTKCPRLELATLGTNDLITSEPISADIAWPRIDDQKFIIHIPKYKADIVFSLFGNSTGIGDVWEGNGVYLTETNEAKYVRYLGQFETVSKDSKDYVFIAAKQRVSFETISDELSAVDSHLTTLDKNLDSVKGRLIAEEAISLVRDQLNTYYINRLTDKIDSIDENAGHFIRVVQERDLPEATPPSERAEFVNRVQLTLLGSDEEPIAPPVWIDLRKEHIIQKVVLNYAAKKLVATCFNGDVITCDISEFINDVNKRLADEIARAKSEEARIEKKVNDLDYTPRQADIATAKTDGKYVLEVKQVDGQLSEKVVSFITDISAGNANQKDNTNAPTAKAVSDLVNALDYTPRQANLDTAVTDGKYVLEVKQVDGKLSEKVVSFITDISAGATSQDDNTNAPTAKAVATLVNALDYTPRQADIATAELDGKYVLETKQVDGQLSEKIVAFDQIIDTEDEPHLNTNTHKNAPTTKAVWDLVNALDFAETAEEDATGTVNYINRIKEKNGLITATPRTADAVVDNSATHKNVATTKAVWDAIDALDYTPRSTVTPDGNYVLKIAEDNGKVSETVVSFDTTAAAPISALSTDNNAPTSRNVYEYLWNATTGMIPTRKYTDADATITNDSGYVQAVNETNGIISVTHKAFDTALSNTSLNAPTNKLVYDTIMALDVPEVGSNGNYIKKIKEDDGKITATLQQFDNSSTGQIQASSTDDNAPTSKNVFNFVTNSINALDVTEVGADGSFIYKVREEDGKVIATVRAMDTAPTAGSLNAVTSTGIKTYVDTTVGTGINSLNVAAVTAATNQIIPSISEVNGKIVVGTPVNISLPNNQVTLNGIAGTSLADVTPATVSKSNILADQNFVNSSIATATATFRGTFAASRAEFSTFDPLDSATTTKVNTLLTNAGVTGTNNDYVYIDWDDSVGRKFFFKYKYDATRTSNKWQYEYTLNNTGFTAEQWAAITSGITSTWISTTEQRIAKLEALVGTGFGLPADTWKVIGSPIDPSTP